MQTSWYSESKIFDIALKRDTEYTLKLRDSTITSNVNLGKIVLNFFHLHDRRNDGSRRENEVL